MERRYLSGVRLTEPLPGGSYLNGLPAVRWLASHEEGLPIGSDVTLFVGENGTGKSTLLEAVAVAYGFNPEGGTKNFNFSTAATHSGLHRHLTLRRGRLAQDGFFLRAESFYNLASNLEELERTGRPGLLQSYGGASLHDQSHGESFLALVNHRFRGHGLYILDEPEAALSPARLLALMARMRQLERCDSQFLIATHSPILMAYPGARVYELSEEGVKAVDYRDTAHYQLTRRFLNDPDGMLHMLFQEE